MDTSDDQYQSCPFVKQSKVRKLRTYASSTSISSGSISSINNSPNVDRQKQYHHHNGDTDEGYASFTTTSTAFGSNSSTTLNKDDSAYYTSVSERLLTSRTTSSPSSASRIAVETDSDKSEISDEDEVLKDLVDWPSLNRQVQKLVSRLDKWLHNPLPDRYIPIEKAHVEHAYPILSRRASSIPLSINLSNEEPAQVSHPSNYVIDFVQNDDTSKRKTSIHNINPRPRVHFNLPTEQLRHCTTCSRLIQLTSSKPQPTSLTTCPYCDQTYCSKVCQKDDWPIHKRQCLLSNSYSCCGHILRLMKSNPYLLKRLSALASSGYLSSGRGATLLHFDNIKEADAYVQQSSNNGNTRLMATYWSINDTQMNQAIENLRPTEYEHLKELCMNYDPSHDFVCHVTIGVEDDKNNTPYTCVSRTIIHKLLESPPDTPTKSTPSNTYPTLYLTSLNYGDKQNNSHHMRQVFFAKLQIELRQRGIEIEEHYPDLYNKLCNYISPNTDEEKLLAFTPACLFMRHRHTQQLFMCVITPESEPDRSWVLDRNIIDKQLNICDTL